MAFINKRHNLRINIDLLERINYNIISGTQKGGLKCHHAQEDQKVKIPKVLM